MNRGRQARRRPTQVAAICAPSDDVVFPLGFTVFGNQTDIEGGNPIPYTRMTQRSAHVSQSAIRYRHWKTYVREAYLRQVRGSLPALIDGLYRLDCQVYFLAPAPGKRCGHADPENVRKGIQDALFVMGDRHVVGSVTMEHVSAAPRVDCQISIWTEALS